MRVHFRLFPLFVVLLLVAAFGGPAGAASDGFRAALATRLQETGSPLFSARAAADYKALREFYAARDHEPVWVSDKAVLPRAVALDRVLRAAAEEGLDPDDYGADATHALLSASSPPYLIDLEVRLSQALLDYAADLGAGRLKPSQVDEELFVYPQDIPPLAIWEAALANPDIATTLASFAPQHPDYDRLKGALARYRAIAEAGGWPRVASGSALKPGMRDGRVAAIRKRLQATGELADDSAPAAGETDLYDGEIVTAIRRFQSRQGLDSDGVVGEKTRAALDTPVQARINQIQINLERLRWMSDERGERHIIVNLADFTLQIVDRGLPVFESRVVVGAPFHRTPVFSDRMRYLEINPYWNVPTSIARKELLPKFRRSPAEIDKAGYEFVHSDRVVPAATVDLAARPFPYLIRQRPGDQNALGRVKFMFPNKFNIYLHDTPSKSLFAKTERTFSHGCIRVARPIDLAVALLADSGDWSEAKVRAAIERGDRQVVNLRVPVPVHIVYLTAWVDDVGLVQFRNDVYGRDALLARALLGPRATP
ncbi:L,D-transpeptidase family protein [Oceanibacterium hippocampi]|uniref:Murein L,D-transpeptidase n=1 Tax=Oceanibacterium hippocampi TaxID=745714 RepID=A0A1Y5TD13_9PROT|nr:L,D-transpeptidase family protein [Oceanibacterium hippocampi]SLN59053.1 murein L,D-transpeptidase [Oceanibacterium hippocampi]